MKSYSIFAAAALALTMTACTVNPVTGRQELSFISAEQEVAIGKENYKPSQQAQGGRYIIDPEIQFYVAGVGKKLAAVSDRPGLPYEFVVLNNPVPNAWALPGGKIAVNSGLLLHLEDESQLAAVLGHEIVHAAARHGASQMTRGTLVGLGAQIAGIAANSQGFGQLGGMAAQLGAAAWMARYGREDELEADNYGMEYMVRAGYDPRGAVRLQETFVKLNESRQQDFISGLFASHPPSPERVARNRDKAAALPKDGITNRELYQRRIAQLKKDEPAYKAQEAAIKALKAKDANAALKHLDRAIDIQPKEGQFWELRGHAWDMLDNKANAEKAFSTAISNNPDYFSHHLARGLLRYEQGKTAGARTDLENSYRLLPTSVASYYLGEISYASGNRQQAVAYYQKAAQAGGEYGKQAEAKLSVLELSTAPDKYIASGAYIGSDGYLRIAIRNNAGIAVQNIVVELSEMANAFVVAGSRQLNISGQLAPGQERVIKTRTGPFEDSSAASRFRTKVVAASPVQQ